MRRSCVAAVLASLGFAAHAGDAVVDPPVQAKSLVESSASVKAIGSITALRQANAPFAAAARDPFPQLAFREEQMLRGPQGACENSTHDLCYDAADGRLVYRSARRFMPKIGELTPESVSLRPNRITFKYSFK